MDNIIMNSTRYYAYLQHRIRLPGPEGCQNADEMMHVYYAPQCTI